VQVSAATVIDRGAPLIGQPVSGSRMWLYRTPSLTRHRRESPLVANAPLDKRINLCAVL
jgi:hypothetical protein